MNPVAVLPRFLPRFLVVLTLLLLAWICLHTLHAQAPEPTSYASRIARDQSFLADAQQRHASPTHLALLWIHLAVDLQEIADLPRAEQAYNAALNLLEPLPDQRGLYAVALDNLGALYLTFGRLDEGARCSRQAYEIRLRLGDPLLVARSRRHLAEVALLRHKFKDAAHQADQAADEFAHAAHAERDHISALITSSLAHCLLHDCATARRSAEQAVALARTTSPTPTPTSALGQALMAAAFTQWSTGADDQAAASLRQGVQALEATLPPESPLLRDALTECRMFLKHAPGEQDARMIEQELTQQIAPRQPACNNCTVSVYAARDIRSSGNAP